MKIEERRNKEEEKFHHKKNNKKKIIKKYTGQHKRSMARLTKEKKILWIGCANGHAKSTRARSPSEFADPPIQSFTIS